METLPICWWRAWQTASALAMTMAAPRVQGRGVTCARQRSTRMWFGAISRPRWRRVHCSGPFEIRRGSMSVRSASFRSRARRDGGNLLWTCCRWWVSCASRGKGHPSGAVVRAAAHRSVDAAPRDAPRSAS